MHAPVRRISFSRQCCFFLSLYIPLSYLYALPLLFRYTTRLSVFFPLFRFVFFFYFSLSRLASLFFIILFSPHPPVIPFYDVAYSWRVYTSSPRGSCTAEAPMDHRRVRFSLVNFFLIAQPCTAFYMPFSMQYFAALQMTFFFLFHCHCFYASVLSGSGNLYRYFCFSLGLSKQFSSSKLYKLFIRI